MHAILPPRYGVLAPHADATFWLGLWTGFRPGRLDDLDHPIPAANCAALITSWNLGLTFRLVLLIASLSSFFMVRKVLKNEPFDIILNSSLMFGNCSRRLRF